MRYPNLSIILSLLSFNSYGIPNDGQAYTFMILPSDITKFIITEAVLESPKTVFELSQVSRGIRNITNHAVENNAPLKTLRDLHNNRDSWIKAAKKAGLNNQEPDHLLEILEVEKRLFAELLKQKESTIGNDPIEWKKHAIASLLSYTAAWNVAYNAAWYAAWNVVYNAAKNAADKAAWGAAWNTAWNAARGAADKAARFAARNTALDVAKNTSLGVARNTGSDAADKAARFAALAVADKAVNDLSDYNQIGRVAYRVAETQAWISVLDPSLNIFETIYDEAYSHLEDVSEEDLGEWFSSQEAFESKLNEYFVNNEELNDRSKEFLKHLQAHLSRMIPKM